MIKMADHAGSFAVRIAGGYRSPSSETKDLKQVYSSPDWHCQTEHNELHLRYFPDITNHKTRLFIEGLCEQYNSELDYNGGKYRDPEWTIEMYSIDDFSKKVGISIEELKTGPQQSVDKIFWSD